MVDKNYLRSDICCFSVERFCQWVVSSLPEGHCSIEIVIKTVRLKPGRLLELEGCLLVPTRVHQEQSVVGADQRVFGSYCFGFEEPLLSLMDS